MTELETLMRAKMYMDKLASGINPIDDSILPENDTINNERLSKCFIYVSGVLDKVIKADEKKQSPKEKKVRFSLGLIDTSKFEYSDEPIRISELSRRISATANNELMKNIPTKAISDWLMYTGLLESAVLEDGKLGRRPTDEGISLGIISEKRTAFSGREYTAVYFTKQGQAFVVDNVDAIFTLYEQVRAARRKAK